MGVSASDQQALVDRMNLLRSQLAKGGTMVSKDGIAMDKADNMFEVVSNITIFCLDASITINYVIQRYF